MRSANVRNALKNVGALLYVDSLSTQSGAPGYIKSVLIEARAFLFILMITCLHQSCFFFQMLEKFAEDDRIEQMNAQKRRMKQLEHKRAVEKLIEDRRIQFQRERVRRRSLSRRFGTVAIAVLSFCVAEYFVFLFKGSRARGSP